jgi:hypothetical protein
MMSEGLEQILKMRKNRLTMCVIECCGIVTTSTIIITPV